MTIKLVSTVFDEGDVIQIRHTCEGEDISPPLAWSFKHPDTESFAIICEDPDAPGGTFVHWVIFNIPGDAKGLSAGISDEKVLKNGATQGINDFGKIGYGGPCPPAGPVHRYYFMIYALDTTLNLGIGATIDQLLEAIEGHVLDDGQLMGIYGR